MANSASGESMIARFVRVVSAFDDRHQTMTVAELSRRTGLPVTTTYRLVNELLHERLLEREQGGAVHIGTKMWELASRGSKMVGLREAALPFMEDVQSVVQYATTLGILDSDEVLYIERIGTHSTVVDISKIAGRLPLHATSSGLILLAHSPAAYQDKILARPLTKYTDTTLTEPALLRRHLADIRQRGFAAMPGVIVPETTGIAVPVFGPDNTAVAALSVIVPRTEENTSARVPVLMAGARGVSRALGWRGELKGTVRQSQ
ncbi:IclR family transcriptional regulator [Pseudarthrobacter sp. BIM B-2242]|uniref:IclR family transcriptional regulator n=1 Tax=Pseudarthrobacter sp. BIM B-2242 TaxID=2772401 RepID=UPI00168A5460|nr:IclR family transcriptional regulator [Pseudarthrobacter sp. BIM B-2242]QOD04406.1 IclR family transcriptional regulator [Pseudarthrobacter sp. BIM B-2242]